MKKEKVAVYLLPGTRRKLEEAREIEGITMSGIITAAINTYLRREGL